jgi:hypothetical protein
MPKYKLVGRGFNQDIVTGSNPYPRHGKTYIDFKFPHEDVVSLYINNDAWKVIPLTIKEYRKLL